MMNFEQPKQSSPEAEVKRKIAPGEKVNVRRTNNNMEDDWIILASSEEHEEAKVVHSRPDGNVDAKTVTYAQLREWNPDLQ